MKQQMAAKDSTRRSSAELPPLASMAKPPFDAREREAIGEQMWEAMLLRFEAGLSEKDRQLWHNPRERVEEAPEHLRLMHTFDAFLLGQFAEWGWRLLMSVHVIHRISEWEKHDPALLERLGRELALKSRVLRGEKAAPFAEDIDVFADGAIEELGRLLRLQRENFCKIRRGVSCVTIAEWMQSEIRTRPTEFPLLKANLPQLHGFVHNLPKADGAASRSLKRGDMRARGFFLLWYAQCSNRSVKDVQNELSRRRAQRRRSTQRMSR
jgi:hypothetical protein